MKKLLSLIMLVSVMQIDAHGKIQENPMASQQKTVSRYQNFKNYVANSRPVQAISRAGTAVAKPFQEAYADRQMVKDRIKPLHYSEMERTMPITAKIKNRAIIKAQNTGDALYATGAAIRKTVNPTLEEKLATAEQKFSKLSKPDNGSPKQKLAYAKAKFDIEKLRFNKNFKDDRSASDKALNNARLNYEEAVKLNPSFIDKIKNRLRGTKPTTDSSSNSSSNISDESFVYVPRDGEEHVPNQEILDALRQPDAKSYHDLGTNTVLSYPRSTQKNIADPFDGDLSN